MQSYGTRPGLKLAGIALLALAFVVPLAFVSGLTSERQQRQEEARAAVAEGWGARQALYPAFVEQPCRRASSPAGSATTPFDPRPACERLFAMPDRLSVDATLATELRQRGLFRVPVYTATARVEARFAREDLVAIDGEQPLRIGLALSDPGGIRRLADVRVDGSPVRLEPGADDAFSTRTLVVPLPPGDGPITLGYTLEVAGIDGFSVAPLGRESETTMRGAWTAPSFDGAFLPVERTLSDEGFEATWRVPGYSRAVPQAALASAYEAAAGSAFGVRFFDEDSVYRQNDRATKYGVLVIALIFGALYLFERLAKERRADGSMHGVPVHPVQYALVGVALATFYLLLLAASEHLGFGLAYLVAAFVAVAIVTGYAAASLRSWRRGLAIGALQGGAYGVFYVLVVNDTYALLLGAVTLTVAVAVAMYLLRRIDWYASPASTQAHATT